jgi:uncharacterized protein (TIGR04255 family)
MESNLRLKAAPIVEAVLDIDCDMGPTFDMASLEGPARDAFKDAYPKMRTKFLEEHQIKHIGDGSAEHTAKRGIQAFMFQSSDAKQIVQLREQGYSFNRLAPYSTLDDYLAEIERTWRLFVEVATPVQIRAVRLRYINRLLLPLVEGRLEFTDYLKVSPQLPDESKLTFVGFLNQHSAVESETGNQANIVLTTQPAEGDGLPLILDIGVSHGEAGEVGNWSWILENIESLRSLKNRIFQNTLTESCLKLYQP